MGILVSGLPLACSLLWGHLLCGKGSDIKCYNEIATRCIRVIPSRWSGSPLEQREPSGLHGCCHCCSDIARHNETLGLDFNPPLLLGKMQLGGLRSDPVNSFSREQSHCRLKTNHRRTGRIGPFDFSSC